MLKKAGVAILGLGVVGGGTYEILTKNREYFKKTQGVDLTVEAVLELNKERALALGVEEALAHGSIRFSFGKHNTIEEIDYAVDVLAEAVERLRQMSPLFNAKGEIKNV